MYSLIIIPIITAASYFIAKKNYPVEVRSYEITALWYGIKVFCIGERIFEKVVAPFRILFRKNTLLEPNCIAFINENGDELVRHTETEFKKLLLNKDTSLQKGVDYAFILYEFDASTEEKKKEEEEDIPNKYERHMLLFDDHLKVSNNFKINSTFKLFVVNLKVHIEEINEKYNIKFNFGNDNYFIVGNKLFTRSYLNWLLKHTNTNIAYNNKFNLTENTLYSVCFIDQTMKCVELNNKEHIVIEEETYTIVSLDELTHM